MTTDNRSDALEPRVRTLKRALCLFCRLIAAGLFVVATSTHSVPVAEASAQTAAALVQKIIDARVEAELAPAIVVGIVRKDGTKEFYCAGKLKAGGTEQVDENTIFEIGSISKVLTTLLMAQMEEQGDTGTLIQARDISELQATTPC